MQILSERKLLNFQLASEAILNNKFRSLLTALGIIFGVAAVIAMLAIGNGAKQEILEQIKLVGVNNIVIKPAEEQKEEKVDADPNAKKEQRKYSPGLTLQDVKSIERVLPNIEKVSPEIVNETVFVRNGMSRTGKLVGIVPAYFEIIDFVLSEGRNFNEHNLVYGDPVCIIGNNVRTKFFNGENPIDKYIKCGNNWFKVIGVMGQKNISTSNIKNLGIRDYNMDIYTPLQTVLIRVKNRGKVSNADMEGGGGMFMFSDGEEDSGDNSDENINQLDRVVVQVKNSEEMSSAADVISKLMLRRHNEVADFEISVPELLLKQQQRTKDIFNIVLGVIAGISLLVGGIGIMNIMLASVLERIKEIGIRLSMGATKDDIVQQFLFEAVLISVSGGVAGIILGVSLSFIIGQVAAIQTIISIWSIVISFGVAALTGLVFGITPAKRAAQLDPIQSLRYE
jgi:putative ABC transport system permease protein